MELLKLRAADAEDIQVLSAVLQDSIVPVCDIGYEPEIRTFILVAQRLRREKSAEGSQERICCALTINGVKGVHTHGIDLQSEQMLDLLAIILEPERTLNLVFAGDARIRVDLDLWAGVIEDFGEPWPASCHPCHEKARA